MKKKQIFLLFRICESEIDRSFFSVCLGAFKRIQNLSKAVEKDSTKEREAACKLLGMRLTYELKDVEVRD